MVSALWSGFESFLKMSDNLLRAALFFVVILIGLTAYPRDVRAANVNCAWSASGLDFGNISSTNSAATTVGTISYSCTNAGKATSYELFCLGLNATNPTNPHPFENSTGTPLNFGLYQDPKQSQSWGANAFTGGDPEYLLNLTIGGGQSLSGSVTVYGVVYAGQTPLLPGSYSYSFSAKSAYANQSESTSEPPTKCGSLGLTGSFPFIVFARVAADCSVDASLLDFGSEGNLDHRVYGKASLVVVCTAELPYSIALNYPLYGDKPGPLTRQMTNGKESVLYGTYQDGGFSKPWGQTDGDDTVTGVGTGTRQVYTVFGMVEPQITPSPATYSDTIVVSLTY